MQTDRLEDAEEAYKQALSAFVELNSPLGQANLLKRLGDLYMQTARLKEAEAAYQQALPIFVELGSRISQAATLSDMGRLALAQGDVVRGFEHGLGALKLYREVDN